MYCRGVAGNDLRLEFLQLPHVVGQRQRVQVIDREVDLIECKVATPVGPALLCFRNNRLPME